MQKFFIYILIPHFPPEAINWPRLTLIYEKWHRLKSWKWKFHTGIIWEQHCHAGRNWISLAELTGHGTVSIGLNNPRHLNGHGTAVQWSIIFRACVEKTQCNFRWRDVCNLQLFVYIIIFHKSVSNVDNLWSMEENEVPTCRW